MATDKLTRRTLGGIAAAGIGAPLLAACSSDDSGSATDSGASPSPSDSSPSAASSSAAPSETAAATSEAPAAEGFATTADIEVGGGSIFADEEVVVTQPTEGEFKGFTSICSHQGCPVTDVSDGTINCDCHGSKYDIATGEVVEGPATFGLAEEAITVTGDQITLG